MKKWKKGSSNNDTLFIIIIVVLLLLSWVNLLVTKKGTSANPFSVTIPLPENSYSSQNSGSGAGSQIVSGQKSQWYELVNISSGNASSEYQPGQESIILRGSGQLKSPVNISGWRLENGKGSRTYQVGNTITHFDSDIAIIPNAVNVFLPKGANPILPIMLPPNGQVTIVSGSANYNGTSMPSFRENECTGYLTRDTANPFYLNPSVSTSCPAPSKESGVTSLEQSCRQFVEALGYCRTPDFDTSVIIDGLAQKGYVDGVGGLSSSCQDYLRAHYNYNSCVSNHLQDKNFFTDNWRVYLNRPWELWAVDHETITLFDSEGKIVSQYSY
jgi:hypothetical protein